MENMKRMKSPVNLHLAEKIYFYKRICKKLTEDLNQAIENCIAGYRYHFSI